MYSESVSCPEIQAVIMCLPSTLVFGLKTVFSDCSLVKICGTDVTAGDGLLKKVVVVVTANF